MFYMIGKRKILGVLVLLCFSVNLAAYSNAFTEGERYLKKARQAQLRGNDSDEQEYLQKSFQAFKKGSGNHAALMQIYTGRLLKKEAEIEKIAKELVKNNRKQYLAMIAELSSLNMGKKKDLKGYLMSIEDRIPFIETIKLRKHSISPYRYEKQYIDFSLNETAHLSLYIEGNQKDFSEIGKGSNTLIFPWKDQYVNKKTLRLTLNSSNDFSGDTKRRKINLDISMPAKLYYSGGDFSIKGKHLKDETKTIISKEYYSKRVVPSILLLGGTIGLGLLSSGMSNEPNYDANGKRFASDRTLGFIGTGLVAVFVITYAAKSFSKKTKNKYKKIVPDRSNIKHNQKIRSEIKKKKSEIKVRMQLDDK